MSVYKVRQVIESVNWFYLLEFNNVATDVLLTTLLHLGND